MLSFISLACGHSYSSPENYLVFGSCLNIHSLQEALDELRYSQHACHALSFSKREKEDILLLECREGKLQKITCEVGQFLNCSIFCWTNDCPTLLREVKDNEAKGD